MKTPDQARIATAGEDLHVIHQALGAILERFYSQGPNSPVVAHQSRESLYAQFHRPAPPATGTGLAAALRDFETRVLPASVRTWHPLFLNQMFAGAPPASLAGDALAGVMNTTLATWEAAPAATIIEKTVSEWMAALLGLPEGASGIFVPGGSMANLLGLALARDTRLAKDNGRRGLATAPAGAILCSEATHYSIANAARLLGIGTEGLVTVKTGTRMEMDPSDFPRALGECARRGRHPFAIVLTAGAPVTGGVDPLAALVPLAHQHGLHVHVDAAFGGTLAMTRERPRLAGIEAADSITWDAHKWLHVPLPCSALLVPDASRLKAVFENPAGYLFHSREETGPVDDLGRYTPLCAKRFDALKLWLVWQAWGTEGLRAMAESRLALAERFHGLLEASPDFVPAYKPVTPIQCFRHCPPGMPPAPPDAMHRWIREQLRERGHAFINLATLEGSSHFRVILINPLTRETDLIRLLDDIRALAREYCATLP